MRSFLLGSVVVFLVSIAPVAADDTKTSSSKSLDGAWTVVCLEKNGQPVPDSHGMTVKGEGGTITCTGRDGKPTMTFKLDFGPNGTVKVTETETANSSASPASAKAGVYVLTRDYLAICVHDANAKQGANGQVVADGPQSKSHCTVILRREGAKTNEDK
jgi:uncharacterized protein (TIGR03067 family)